MMKKMMLVKPIFVVSVLQLINEASAYSPYNNDIDEELDRDPVEPVYLPSPLEIGECTYVRHFGAYSGNISCPDTAAALTSIQTKGVRQTSGVSPSNQYLPNTNWSMQCECPLWSYQDNLLQLTTATANAHPRSTWMPFIISHPNTSFSCSYNEFLSGLAYQYNEQSQNFTWWGRCTRFRGYFVGGESCQDSAWRLPDGADNLLILNYPVKTLHGVDDYPVQQSSNSLAVLSNSGSNRREKKFRECIVTPIPGCDNPTIDNGSITLLPSVASPTIGQLDLESGRDRTKYGDSLQVSCNTGYYVDGPSVTTCQTNGTWTLLPTCKACRPIRNCLSMECKHGNESLCLECKAYTNYHGTSLKLMLNKNRKRCRIVPHIYRRKVVSEIMFEHWGSVRLDCPAVGRPAPTIKWTSLTRNKSVDRTFPHYRWTMGSNGSLVLKNLRDTDEGVYMCTAVNDVGSDSMNITLISKEAELRRELEGNASLSAPVIHNKVPFMLFFTNGIRALAYCNVTGTPQPTINWYKLEVKQGEVHSYRLLKYNPVASYEQHDSGTLEFYWIDEAWDVGIYTCLATNKYGSDVMHKYICVGNSCDDIRQTP